MTSKKVSTSDPKAIGSTQVDDVAVEKSPSRRKPATKKSAAKSDGPKKSEEAIKKSGDVFQFKITLQKIKPAIWRRIQVENCTLGKFSSHILSAFGWSGGHLHEFTIGGISFGSVDRDFGMPNQFEDEDNMELRKLLPDGVTKTRWDYAYDFGDGWVHTIQFEGRKPNVPSVTYPLCLAGARACPPDDCGGPWGYVELLGKLADPNHPEHDEAVEWCGSLDPEEFDPVSSTKMMKHERPSWR